MIRDAEKQLKDLDAALKDIDIYKAMKEKTGVSSHATGGRVSLSSDGLAGMLGE
jgi:ABC-type enterochelin transport system substrate-binding protein